MRLLIVDDAPVFRDRLKRYLLVDPTMRVVGEADNGVDGLLAFERLQPDVILLDLQMPAPDGYSVLLTVKQRAPETRVVILTAHSTALVREHCRQLQADVVIDKGDVVAQIMPALWRLAERLPERQCS